MTISEVIFNSNANVGIYSQTYDFSNSQQEKNENLFFSNFSVSNRPLTSLSYAERRECISDYLAAGSLRAFDAKHKHRTAVLEKSLEKQWEEQERVRLWRTAHMRNQITSRRRERDKGVLESIVDTRNKQRKEFLSKGISTEKISNYMGRMSLPKETRAVHQRQNKPVFFWG